MDALDLLTADHNRVRELFARFDEAKEQQDTGEMDRVADQIFDELRVHTGIEERIFYPAVHDLREELGELVDEGLQEHHVVDVLMDELAELRPGDPEWTAKMTVLIENVEHHAGEEESELFPQVRKATTGSTREELGRRLESLRAELGGPRS